MSFYYHIPHKYMRWVPAVWFAMLGSYIFIACLMNGPLGYQHIILLILAYASFINHKIVQAVFGILLVVLSAFYSFITILAFVLGQDDGKPTRTPLVFFMILVSLFSLTCAFAVLYLGTRPRRPVSPA